MPTHADLADIERLLLMLEGARIAATHELVQDGELRKATRRAGEANGYRLVRQILVTYRETGDLPAFTRKDHWLAYAELARAMDTADEAVTDDEANAEADDPALGVQ